MMALIGTSLGLKLGGIPFVPFIVILVVVLILVLERMDRMNNLNRYAGWIVVVVATLVLSVWVLLH